MIFKQAHVGNYQPGRTQPIQYIVVHYTANKGDTAQNNLDYFARVKTGTGAHYFVDENEVCQSVKDTDVAWHCGSDHPAHPYCRNANSMGVEMCDSVGAVPAATMARTTALVRELMGRYNIPADHVLRHYDVTGKRCPAPWVDSPREWAAFKAMLEEDDDMLTQEQFNAMAEAWLAQRGDQPLTQAWQKNGLEKAVAAGVTDGSRPLALCTRLEAAVMAAAGTKTDT